MSAAEVSVYMLKTVLTSPLGLQEGEMGGKFHGKPVALLTPVIKLSCCCLLIAVLTAAVVVLSVALSVRKEKQIIKNHIYANCPRNWIGFGSKCFYFSDDTKNWTYSQTSCVTLGAQLAQFENQEEQNFLRRYKGSSDHWIGLHRESPQHAWKWTDNTEYHNMVSIIRGVGEHAYLNDNGISSAWVYADRKWICSKPNSYDPCAQYLQSLFRESISR
ncbi:C-type lectin domain family 2 member D11-like [Nannospalax galili]|uniref:C-type lectin domain family 2 member D11-like n=1 Tax=Nannospalax galili TaxID=1026970 RepID=UPI000819C3F0|nr:C-type lectin domain family 2 member D11-like [Nannospalax galili]